MVDVPRHLEPSDAERLHTFLARMTPGGAGGQSRAVGPILSRVSARAAVAGAGEEDTLDAVEFKIDVFSITGTATSSFTLTFDPLDDSWNPSLNGVMLDEGTDYSMSGQTVTILNASTLFAGAATQGSPWELRVEYAYLAGVPTVPTQILLSDNFNRADNGTTVGPPQTGPSPGWQYGEWGISSNSLAPTGAVTYNEAHVTWDIGVTEYVMSFTVAAMPTDGGPVVRADSGGLNSTAVWFLVLLDASDVSLHIKNPANTYTAVESSGVGCAVGDSIEVEVSETYVKVRVNDVEIIDYASADLAANTQVGFRENFTKAGRYDDLLVVPL